MPRIIASAMASPPSCNTQDDLRDQVCELLFGSEWADRTDTTEQVRRVTRIFEASTVKHRQMAIHASDYYNETRTTGERMADYQRLAYPVARQALDACMDSSAYCGEALTDFIVVSCTGYGAPGLDILLARDLPMRRDVRRVVIGHMGCFGALVGLRDAMASVRSREGSLVALLSVELSSLHYAPTTNLGSLTSMALFGDAAAAFLLTADPAAEGPAVVDTYCASDFDAMDQMAWNITDEGFEIVLSIRVPVTLMRNVGPVVERLLRPHELGVKDVTHWLIHPGGPSVLECVQRALDLSEEQMALAWQVLRDHGNCSSTTVMLMLDRLLRSGTVQAGEWGVMMAFGPGLTLEMCLLLF